MNDDDMYSTPDVWLKIICGVSLACALAVGYHNGIWKGLLAYPFCIVTAVFVIRRIKP